MRICTVLCLAVALFLPATTLAQGPQETRLQISRPVLAAGQTQTITVVARDLTGSPLVGASVRATVHYGVRVAAYPMKATDRSGTSTVSFRPPAGTGAVRAVVDVSVTNGFLETTLTGSFRLSGGKGAATGAASSAHRLVVVARALPPVVTSPSPVWLVIVVHDTGGKALNKAPVDVALLFKAGTRHVSGVTDTHGVATIKLATGSVHSSETVQVGVVAHLGTTVGSAATQFSVKPHPATATPTPTSTPVPTPTSTPTSTATATSVTLPPAVFIAPPTATSTPTPIPTATSTAVPTPTKTAVPTPTSTAVPTPTSTRVPTPTATPVPPSNYFAVPTATPTANCPGSMDGCMQAVLNMINQTRAQNGVAPLTLNDTQSMGTGTCPGSYGHSLHMAQTGVLAHDQFPADICVRAYRMGENIGYDSSGNELNDLQWIHSQMMSEPYTVGCQGNHACNITYPGYSEVGIGIVESNGTTWLTEDFLG